LVCAHSLAYDEKPNYQMLKKILNPGEITLGPLEFSTGGQSVNLRTPDNQKVVSRKAATKQVNQMQNRSIEKNIHSERSAESCLTGRKVQKEEPPTGLLNSETAQVYLADYGLCYRYCPNGNHKQYQENPRKGHNGTIEFTSVDAH